MNIYPGATVEIDGNALLQNPFWRQLGNWTGDATDWEELLQSLGLEGNEVSQPDQNQVGFDFAHADMFVRCSSESASAPYSPDGSDIIGIDYAIFTYFSNEFPAGWGPQGQQASNGTVPITLTETNRSFKNEPVGTVGSG